MKIAICDDDSQDLVNIQELLLKVDGLEVSAFSSAFELYRAFAENHFSIVLLDIEMNEPNGYEIAKRLKTLKEPPLIIFVTKNSTYSVRGYEVAFRYITKPIKEQRFYEAINAALDLVSPMKLVINTKDSNVILSASDIIYIEVFHYISVVHLINDTLHNTRTTLSYFENNLNPQLFYRPHKSFLVNLNYIREYKALNIKMVNGDDIPISRLKAQSFSDALVKFHKKY